MRVPSIGLTLEERRIVREGYQLAERLLRNYQAPPTGFSGLISKELAECRQMAITFYRALVRS